MDKRIKATYIAESTAQKTKLYDMYARFLRWASDRLDENGVVAFVSNSSFINSRTYDGFRKCVAEEFNEIYIIDMKGNARTTGERRKQEAGNVFDDQIRVGIAVYFLVKNKAKKGCKIFYNCIEDYQNSKNKIAYLTTNKLDELAFLAITPDKNHNWINLSDNDFDSLIPVANKDTKAAKTQAQENALFKLYSLGVSTNRDEWVTDYSEISLRKKMTYFTKRYHEVLSKKGKFSNDIKWSRNLKRRLEQKREELFSESLIKSSMYRPYFKQYLYDSKLFVDERGAASEMFPISGAFSKVIAISGGDSASKPFQSMAIDTVYDLHFTGDTQAFSL